MRQDKTRPDIQLSSRSPSFVQYVPCVPAVSSRSLPFLIGPRQVHLSRDLAPDNEATRSIKFVLTSTMTTVRHHDEIKC